jgi:hypothetical protein
MVVKFTKGLLHVAIMRTGTATRREPERNFGERRYTSWHFMASWKLVLLGALSALLT